MLYLIGQTTLLLAIAALFGGVIGWMLRGVDCRRKIAALWKQHSADTAKPERELSEGWNQMQRGKGAPDAANVEHSRQQVQTSARGAAAPAATSFTEKKRAIRNRVEQTRMPAAKASSDRDDLKRIHGIGPYLEKRLNALGIRKFEQIANFRDEEIAEIAKQIGSFPDRIRRDNWMKSARQLQLESE